MPSTSTHASSPTVRSGSTPHSGDAIDIDARFEPNRSFGFDASGTQEAAPVDDVESVDGTVQIIEGDAQVSTQTGIALGVFAADCLPVLCSPRTACPCCSPTPSPA